MTLTSLPRTTDLLRNLVLVGTPFGMGIVSMIHPHLMGEHVFEQLQPQLALWLIVHLVQLVLIGLLGVVIWLLMDGLESRAARIARLAVVPFLVFYAAFDSIVGIGTGVLALLAQASPRSDHIVAGRLVQQFWEARFLPPIGPVILVADLAWIIALSASAVALKRARASRLVAGLLVLAAIAFGIDHSFPFGTLGMLGLWTAVILWQRQSISRTKQQVAITFDGDSGTRWSDVERT